MKNISIFLLATMIITISCKRGPQAPFDEDDEVTIHGLYSDESGAPIAEQWVGFWINSPESFFTNFLGLDPEESDRTDNNGEYSETFMGADLMDNQGATFEVIVMNYDPNWPDTMPKVACLFFPLSTDIEVPDMHLWRGDPQTYVNNSNETIECSWSPLTDTANGNVDNYIFQVKATQDGPFYTMWQEDVGTNTSITFPGFVLPENYALKWRVLAEIPRESDDDYGFVFMTDPDTTDLSDFSYSLLSLGKNLFAEAYADTFRKGTDGKWGPWPTYCITFAATNVSWIYVDLSDTSHTINGVVLYDLTTHGTISNPGFEIYVSNDTTNWGSAVASNDQKNGYFYFDGFSTHGRYVKLQAKDNGIGIAGLREITIFGQ